MTWPVGLAGSMPEFQEPTRPSSVLILWQVAVSPGAGSRSSMRFCPPIATVGWATPPQRLPGGSSFPTQPATLPPPAPPTPVPAAPPAPVEPVAPPAPLVLPVVPVGLPPVVVPEVALPPVVPAPALPLDVPLDVPLLVPVAPDPLPVAVLPPGLSPVL